MHRAHDDPWAQPALQNHPSARGGIDRAAIVHFSTVAPAQAGAKLPLERCMTIRGQSPRYKTIHGAVAPKKASTSKRSARAAIVHFGTVAPAKAGAQLPLARCMTIRGQSPRYKTISNTVAPKQASASKRYSRAAIVHFGTVAPAQAGAQLPLARRMTIRGQSPRYKTIHGDVAPKQASAS